MVIELLGQVVAKLKRTWNLASGLQIVQKIPENYCRFLYLSIGHVLSVNWEFTPCKSEQPLQAMELQEKEKQKY